MSHATPHSFDSLSLPTRLGDGRFGLDVPDGWQQGRGAYGGFVLAALTRVLELASGDPTRPLRTLTGALCGPVVVGPAQLTAEVLRAGSGMSTASARLLQDGEVKAHAVGVFGRARTEERDGVHLPPPTLPPWAGVEPVPVGPPFGPVFGQHFEFRPTGLLPFQGGTEGGAAGWLRMRNPGARRDAAYLVACADVYWPAVYSLENGPRPMATVSFTLDLLGEPGAAGSAGEAAGSAGEAAGSEGAATAAVATTSGESMELSEPLFHRSSLLAVRGGYAVERREIYDETGRLLALNHQTFAILR